MKKPPKVKPGASERAQNRVKRMELATAYNKAEAARIGAAGDPVKQAKAQAAKAEAAEQYHALKLRRPKKKKEATGLFGGLLK